MNNIFEELKKYFSSTPQNEVLKDWESTKADDAVGPTLSEFICYTEQMFRIANSEKIKPKEKTNIIFNNPKYTSGFFIF